MKLNKFMMACGALFLGAVALTSCSSDEENYDFDGSNTNAVFFNTSATTKSHTIYNTPMGVFGTTNTEMEVRSQYTVGGDVNVSAEVDNSLVAAFNAEKADEGITYSELPATLASQVVFIPTKISNGSNVGDTTLIAELPNAACASLTDEYYVIPCKLTLGNVTQGGIYTPEVRGEYNTQYILIHNDAKNFAYTNSKEIKQSITVTPAGTFGEINADFSYNVQAAGNEDFTISATVDNSLIKAYNEANGTEYEQLPASVLSALTITNGKIAAGETACSQALNIFASNDACQAIDGSYLIPLKVTLSTASGKSMELSSVYVIVKTTHSLINDNATQLLGTACSLSEVKNQWKIVSTDNFDASTFSNLFASSVYSRYFCINEKKSTASFVMDLGATHKVSGFMFYNVGSWYLVQDGTVEVSADGTTWTSLGSYMDHNYVAVKDGWYNMYYCVLYGGVAARYVRVTCDVDPESYYWDYLDYGDYYKRYVALRGFNLCYDD